MHTNAPYQRVTFPHLAYEMWVREIEWGKAPYLDGFLYFAGHDAGRTPSLSHDETQAFALGTMQWYALRLMNRFMNARLDANHARFTRSYLSRYLQLRSVYTSGRWCANADELYKEIPAYFREVLRELAHGAHSDLFFSRIILEVYRDMDALLRASALVTREVTIPAPAHYSEHIRGEYPASHFAQLARIAERAGKYVDLFCVQGSYGTGDFIRMWSDFDAVVFLAPSALESESSLLAVRAQYVQTKPVIYTIDLLTHHGIFFLTPLDVRWYPQFFLPVEVYRYAVSIWGRPETLRFSIRDDTYEKMQSFYRFLQYFRAQAVKDEYVKSLGEWKTTVANVLLLPSLLLQARGVYVHKKYSFERFPEVFPNIDCHVVTQASQLRATWKFWHPIQKLPPFLFRYTPFALHDIPLRRSHYHAKARPIPRQPEFVRAFVNGALAFCEASLDEVLHIRGGTV